MTRVVFLGTPEFAVPSLQALKSDERFVVVGVVTQPDRPAGRGQVAKGSAVKQFATQAGLPVIQPRRLSTPEAVSQLAEWAPDLVVVAAFGQLLKPTVLEMPRHGCVNVHASLLPRHRGAAPIPAAILAGDAETGVTLMRMDQGLDTGPLLASRSEPIHPDDTSQSLAVRLAELGASLLVEVLPKYLAGEVTLQPQDEALATYAPQLKKTDGLLDFSLPAREVARRVRAFNPWPGAFAPWPHAQPGAEARTVKILDAEVIEAERGEPGWVIDTEAGPAITCASGALLLKQVQAPGRRPMPARDFARGARDFVGARLQANGASG